MDPQETTPQETTLCPRCAAQQTEVLARSAVSGVWVVLICRRCTYSWRSSEPPAQSSNAHYPDQFKLSEADIANARAVPPIPESVVRLSAGRNSHALS